MIRVLLHLLFAILFAGLMAVSASAQPASISGIINIYTSVTRVMARGVDVTDAGGFGPGDTVVIIQMKGAFIHKPNTAGYGTILSYNNAGNYEFGIIDSVLGLRITLRDTIVRRYDPEYIVQLVRVPHYCEVDVDGLLTARPWDGRVGGVLVLESSGSVRLNADIDVSRIGFAGGKVSRVGHTPSLTDYFYPDGSPNGGEKGENISMYDGPRDAGRGAPANGGGGGNSLNAGGGGGGNGGGGGTGGNESSLGTSMATGGREGKSLLWSNQVDKIFLGGGGGGGQQDNDAGTPGGYGGGIVIIRSTKILGNAHAIRANGQDAAVAGNDGAGGGGGGGAILLDAGTVSSVRVELHGGNGGDNNSVGLSACYGTGGGGGGGAFRVRGPAVPSDVTVDNRGGNPGGHLNAVSPCFGMNYGAADGLAGVIIPDLVIRPAIVPSALVTVDAGSGSSICPGDSVLLAGSGSGVLSWRWFPSDGLSCPTCPRTMAHPAITTVYHLIGYGAAGCLAVDSAVVIIRPPFPVNAGPDRTICAGDSVLFDIADRQARYHWSPGDGLSCSDCASPVARPAGTTTYIVTAQALDACPGADTVTIIVTPRPVVTADGATAICAGSSAQLSAHGDGAYRWEPAATLSCADCADPTATPLVTTTYTVTVTNPAGCSSTANLTITVNSSPGVDAGPDATICAGEGTILTATGGDSYAWSPADGLSCVNCPAPAAHPARTTTYFVVMAVTGGCSSIDSVTVTVRDPIIVDAGKDVAICAGGSVVLAASGGDLYRWEPAGALSCADCASPVASPATTTIFHLIGLKSGQCPGRDSVTVTVLPAPTVDAGPDVTICAGDAAGLAARGGDVYAWSPSAGLSCADCPAPIADPSTTTSYVVTATNAAGCVASDTVTVFVNERRPISAGPDRSICGSDSVRLPASGAAGYAWSPADGLGCADCASPMAHPSRTTTYIVSSTDAIGCPGSDTVTVFVDGDARLLHARIASDLKVFPGSPISIPILLDSPADGAGVSRLDLSLRYQPAMLRFDGADAAGALTDGWNVTGLLVDRIAGSISLHLSAPPGAFLAGPGTLIRLGFTAFLGSSDSSLLPFDIAGAGERCIRFTADPGLVRLDSICGLSFRLIEGGLFRYSLRQNFPNPFNPSTVIAFSLGLDGPTELSILDIYGRRVATLAGGIMRAGMYESTWDATGFSSGLYYCRIISGDWSATTTMMLVK
ncbi:MAG: hypothetical protein JWQ98_50 [Chlorobi bacterium]|nr:hypothetical protein [Chlorobiota bacterium]